MNEETKELPNGDLRLPNGKTIPLAMRTKTEVYSRVVGYLRPVAQWNKGKKAEFDDRVVFDVHDSVNTPKS